jgi:hypothetical protein
VRLEVGVNRTTDVLNAEDIKIEQRVHEATVTSGKYTLTGVPAVPGIYYKLTALGFTAGGVEFADKVLFNKDGPDIGSGATSTASTKVATDVVDQLTVISISPFVTGVAPIEITFNVQPENLGVSTSLITAGGVPVSVSYDASTIKLTPAYAWKEAKLGVIPVTLTGLRSKNGALLATDETGIWTGSVAVQDEARSEFTITNVINNTIYVADSGVHIELLFNKEIDTGKASQNIYQEISNDAYRATIDGNKLTLVPTTGKWSFNGGQFTLTLKNIRSVDDDVFGSGSGYVITVILPNTLDKFVVESSSPALKRAPTSTAKDTIHIGSDDDSVLVKLKFSKPLSSDPVAIAARKVSVSTGAVIWTLSGDTLILDVSKGELWKTLNEVTLTGFTSSSDQELNGSASYTLVVKKRDVVSFAYIGRASIKLASKSSPISLNFDERLDPDLDYLGLILLEPSQPFTTTLSADEKSLVLTPLGSLDWLFDNTTVTLVGDGFTSRAKGVLLDENGLRPTDAGYDDRDIDVNTGSSGSGTNPLSGVAVSSFTLDRYTSRYGAITTAGDQTIRVLWSMVDKVHPPVGGTASDYDDNGYTIFVYRGSTLVDSADYTLGSFASGTLDSLVPYKSSSQTAYETPATTIAAAVTVPAVTATRKGSGKYSLVIRPFIKNGSDKLVGESTLLDDIIAQPVIVGVANGGKTSDLDLSRFEIPASAATDVKTFINTGNTGTTAVSTIFTVTVQLSSTSDTIDTWGNFSVGVSTELGQSGKFTASASPAAIPNNGGGRNINVVLTKEVGFSAISSPTADAYFTLSISGKNAAGQPAVSTWGDYDAYNNDVRISETSSVKVSVGP